MNLLDDDLRSRLPPLYSHEAEMDPMVHARLFLAGTNWTWYVIEGEVRGGDFLFFGYVIGLDSDFRYFLLSELEQVRSGDGGQVERDLNFAPGRLTDVVPAPDL